MKRYKYLINYINQYGIRTSVVMSQAMLKVLEVLSNLEGMTKEKYLGKIAKKNNEGVSNTLFIRDYMVNELLKIITEVAEGLRVIADDIERGCNSGISGWSDVSRNLDFGEKEEEEEE